MSAPAATVDPWVQLLTGKTLGEYFVGDYLGSGNFGYVFEGTHVATGGIFAIKILKPGALSEAVIDFENEGVLLRQLLSCTGVINVVDGGSGSVDLSNGVHTVPLPIQFLVLARASGSVDELIRDPYTRSRLDWVELLGFWRDVILAVKQMHARSVAHRDLKADNCLMLVSRNLSSVKLADLGRGKDFSLTPTRLPEDYLHGRGDLRFAPPEFLLLQGGSAARDFIAADYYGIGSILVELATGQPMSALAVGDVRAVLASAMADQAVGRRSDLSAFEANFRTAVAFVVEVMPKSIRADASVLLTHLCRPVPADRLARPPYSRDRQSRDGLDWVLRRTDIMIRRLMIDRKTERLQTAKQRRSA